ncbi:probable methyltransferase TARBP1 isoform X2 [Orussus abietinus]|uniref:probable methyltransferase TARBP1 isoform X2 n=1 Tax=Orussus abietinus TaxID=222816 RepID=UPI000625C1F3|nr:probable methyltransferase TARBP1 isoform X2 [Orussus abietinus]
MFKEAKWERMTLHDRFMNLSVIDFSLFTSEEIGLRQSPDEFVNCLVTLYFTKIKEGNLSLKNLETLQLLLSYEYQRRISLNQVHNAAHLENTQYFDMQHTLFPKNRSLTERELIVLLDILSLQIILYADLKGFSEHFQVFHRSSQNYLSESIESRNLYLKVITRLLQSFHLKCQLKGKTEPTTEQKIKDLLCALSFNILNQWLTLKGIVEWSSLIPLLTTMVEVFGANNVLTPLFNLLLMESTALENSLPALCVTTDLYFPEKFEHVSNEQYNLYIDERFWLLLLQSLKASVQQYRKQALYLIKKTSDFMSLHTEMDMKHPKENTIIPFLCTRSKEPEVSSENIKKCFFLILEALEETQVHLVNPSLSVLPVLIKGHLTHRDCGNCFSAQWLQCVFERMIFHKNNAIVKKGIIQALKLPVSVYDEKFLELLIRSMNNTFLYECQNDEESPEVVTCFVDLLTRIECNHAAVADKVIIIISQVLWGPIALFYVSEALEAASVNTVTGNWQQEQLQAVKTLAEINLNIHNRPLRQASQIKFLSTLTKFVKPPMDLWQLTSTLSAFPVNEALQRNSEVWRLITTWLAEIISKSCAMDFVKESCEQILGRISVRETSVSSIALMIAFIEDVTDLQHSKVSLTTELYRNLFNSLDRADSRPYASIDTNVNVIEFLQSLLRLKDYWHKFSRLEEYLVVALKFIGYSIRKSTNSVSYEQMNICASAVSTFFDERCTGLTAEYFRNYMETLAEESIYVLENANNSTVIQRLFALKVLYECRRSGSTKSEKFKYLNNLLDLHKNELRFEGEYSEIGLQGKIASEYYNFIAKHIHLHLEKLPPTEWLPHVSWLQCALNLLDIGGNSIIEIVAAILKQIILKNMPNDPSELVTVITKCWKFAFTLKKSKQFRLAIGELIGSILHENFLNLKDTRQLIVDCVNQTVQEGDAIPILKLLLLEKMETLDKQFPNYVDSLSKALLACLLHGLVPRRDQRIELQACTQACKITAIKPVLNTTVRARAVILLHNILCQNSDCGLKILPLVIEKLEESTGKRYYGDSYLHRIKHRLLQVLLLIEPMIHKAEDTTFLHDYIYDKLRLETNQTSVRIMQEWLLIRMYVQHEHLRNKIWVPFSENITIRPGSVSSIFRIAYHVSRLLNSKQEEYILSALSYVGQYCMGQHFNTRLYSQVIFVRLYELLIGLQGADFALEYKGLHSVVSKSLHRANSTKALLGIQEDFFLTIFHPSEHYSIQMSVSQ